MAWSAFGAEEECTWVSVEVLSRTPMAKSSSLLFPDPPSEARLSATPPPTIAAASRRVSEASSAGEGSVSERNVSSLPRPLTMDKLHGISRGSSWRRTWRSVVVARTELVLAKAASLQCGDPPFLEYGYAAFRAINHPEGRERPCTS